MRNKIYTLLSGSDILFRLFYERIHKWARLEASDFRDVLLEFTAQAKWFGEILGDKVFFFFLMQPNLTL